MLIKQNQLYNKYEVVKKEYDSLAEILKSDFEKIDRIRNDAIDVLKKYQVKINEFKKTPYEYSKAISEIKYDIREYESVEKRIIQERNQRLVENGMFGVGIITFGTIFSKLLNSKENKNKRNKIIATGVCAFVALIIFLSYKLSRSKKRNADLTTTIESIQTKCSSMKLQIEHCNEYDQRISDLIEILANQYIHICSFQTNDYTRLTENERKLMGAFSNNCKSISESLKEIF